MRAAEKKYYTDQIMENKQNSKKLWSIIKHVINRNKRIKFQDKFKLNDGSYTTDMKIICEKFNDFFINVGPSLSKKIPMQNCSPDQYIKMKAVYSLYLEPVTESETRGLINSLKSSAPGYDNIRSSILKLTLPVICTPLTYICNLSLQEMNWKLPTWYRYLRMMTQNFSTITDQCRCCALCQSSLRKSCTTGYSASSINTKFCFLINLDFGNIIPLIWL